MTEVERAPGEFLYRVNEILKERTLDPIRRGEGQAYKNLMGAILFIEDHYCNNFTSGFDKIRWEFYTSDGFELARPAPGWGHAI